MGEETNTPITKETSEESSSTSATTPNIRTPSSQIRGPKPKTKVCVHNLPWNLGEQTFKEAILEWENEYDYFAYFPGRRNPSRFDIS